MMHCQSKIYFICFIYFEIKIVLLPENYVLNNVFSIFWCIVYWLLDRLCHFDHFVYDLRAVFDFEHRWNLFLRRKFNFARWVRGFVNSTWRWGSLSIFHSYCKYGKIPFFPSLKPFQSRSYNCTWLVRVRWKKRTNPWRWRASEPMAMQPAIVCQNGRGVWLYNSLPATVSQISSLQRWWPFFADSSLMPKSAIEATQQPD